MKFTRAKRGPSGMFLGALFGLAVGYLWIPARVNQGGSDREVIADILWIIGSAVLGGMVGAFTARLDRHA
jgi:hypothetical protein